MEDADLRAGAGHRVEPAAMTLADSCVLVIGVALVVVLPACMEPAAIRSLSAHRPAPPWWPPLPMLHYAREAIGKIALALLPVALARRARYGGVIRPAEFLLAACGLTWLVTALGKTAVARQLDGLLPDSGPFAATPAGLGWKSALVAGAVLAGLALVGGRRRLPGWLTSVLRLVAWAGLYDGLWALDGWAFDRFGHILPGDEMARELTAFVLTGPILMQLYAAPAWAAWRDRRRTWLDWAGLGLAAALFLVSETLFLATDYVFAPGGKSSFGWEVGASVLALCAAAALSIGIVGRFGPTWSRRIGSDDDGTRPIPRPLAA